MIKKCCYFFSMLEYVNSTLLDILSPICIDYDTLKKLSSLVIAMLLYEKHTIKSVLDICHITIGLNMQCFL